jgi:hypothetical protein
MRGMRQAWTAAACAWAFQAAAIEAGEPWSLQIPSGDLVVYRGVVNLDAAGSAGGAMLYPAPGVAGLIAAVVTHGVIVESAKNAEKVRLQEQADLVLTPFREQLGEFRYARLLQMALERMPDDARPKLLAAGDTVQGWKVTSSPVFSMTQDQRSLLLDNAFALYRPGDGEKPVYSTTVRVVSQPRQDPGKDWLARGRADSALQEESAHMLVHSLALAWRDARRTAPAAGGFQTLRFPQGGSERVERAQPLEALCERTVARTLRGWLLSVPAPAPADPAASSCENAAAGWR